MPSLSFEVGAVFSIDPQPAITSLEAIGQAFSALDAMLQDSVAATATAVNQMVTEIGRLADAWRAVGAEARSGAGSGGAAGGGGRRGRPTDEAREAERQLLEDRRNADAINRNENQIYSRQEAMARRENDDRGRIYDNQRLTAEMENREFNRLGAVDDGITIPRPPRTGITEITRAREPPGPRNELSMAEDVAAGATGARMFGRGGHAGGVLRGTMPLIGGLAAYEGMSTSMHEDRALAQSLQEMGYDPRSPGFEKMVEEMRGKVSGATAGTIFSEAQGANALPGTAGQFSGLFSTPDARRTAYEGVLDPALKFAEVAEQYHRGSIGESYKAGIGYLAMSQQLTPDKASLGLSQLLALSLATGDTIAQEQNVLKYSLPLGQASGASPTDIMGLTGFMEILGFRGTTAGTGVGQLLMGMTGTGGPVAAQQHRENISRGFESALKLDPKSLHDVRVSRGKEHDIALRALGLEDPKTGKIREDVAPGGHLDVPSFVEHVSASLQKMNPMEALNVLRNAFTVRGSREAAELKDPHVVGELMDFLKTLQHPTSVADLQAQLSTRALQQWEQMLANISNIGNTLATQTLPGLNEMFKDLNSGLVGINNWLKENPLAASIGGWGLLFGGVMTGLGLFGGGLRLAAGVLGLMSAQSAGLTGLAAATAGATSGLLGLVTGVTRLGTILGLLSLSGDTPGGDDDGRAAAQKAGGLDWMNWQKKHPGVGSWIWEHTFGSAPGSPDAEHHLGMSPPRIPYGGGLRDPERHSGATGATQALANTNNITINAGVITESTKKELLDWMTSALKGFLERASEMAQGAHQSQYDYSGGH